MVGNFILFNGDVEHDVVSPYADMASNKDLIKNDVACHISKVLRGFHFKIMFARTLLETLIICTF